MKKKMEKMEVRCPHCGFWNSTEEAYDGDVAGNSIFKCLGEGCGEEFTEFETDGWRKGDPPCEKEMGDVKCPGCTNPSCPEFDQWADNDSVDEIKEQLNGCVSFIMDERVRVWVAHFLLKCVPDYIWEIAASSSGKYHPKYTSGKGGLIRHKRAAVQIALSLFEAKSIHDFSELEQDIIIAALILHDVNKYGETGKDYAAFRKHGQITAAAIMEEAEKGSIRAEIAEAIETHMGHWSKPSPETEIQKFVHLCDYLASRKFLEVNFDEVKV